MAVLHSGPVRDASDTLDAAREELIRQVTLDLLPAPPVRDPRLELTPAQAEALECGGFLLDPILLGTPDDPVKRTIAAYTRLLADSLPMDEAARRLGVSGSRIRQRLGARTLYGIKWQGHWRLPAFQFTEAGALPGLESVLPHLDRTLHPIGVETWFTEPDPDLLVDDRAISPRDWLAAGYPSASVALIASGL